VNIPDFCILNPLLSGGMEALIGCGSGKERQVRHEKLGIKSQKAVGDLGVDGGNETGEGSYLFLLHVPGD
jgi:hypothetical protein